MEYLTLLNYLHVVTSTSRRRTIQTITFFLAHRLTVLNNLFKLKHYISAHQSTQ